MVSTEDKILPQQKIITTFQTTEVCLLFLQLIQFNGQLLIKHKKSINLTDIDITDTHIRLIVVALKYATVFDYPFPFNYVFFLI